MPTSSRSRRLRPGPEARLGSVCVRQFDYPPGHRQPSHAHDATGITLVVAGDIRETAHGREEDASALSVVVKPAGTVHADVAGPRGARTVQVEIHEGEATAFGSAGLGGWRWLHAGPGVRPLLGLRRTLLDPDAGPDPEDLVFELLGEIAASGPRPGRIPAWVRRVREAVEDLAPEGVRVRDLAELAGVHPVSLTRAFRRAYGVPVTLFRRRVRLRRAAAQVVATDRSLSSIAHAAGYADHAHLCREVRSATGLTPSGLRRAARR